MQQLVPLRDVWLAWWCSPWMSSRSDFRCTCTALMVDGCTSAGAMHRCLHTQYTLICALLQPLRQTRSVATQPHHASVALCGQLQARTAALLAACAVSSGANQAGPAPAAAQQRWTPHSAVPATGQPAVQVHRHSPGLCDHRSRRRREGGSLPLQQLQMAAAALCTWFGQALCHGQASVSVP